MKISFSALAKVALLTLVSSLAWAQDSVVVRVGTSTNGIKFFVDGVEYQQTLTFNWPAGSKHTISLRPTQYSVNAGTRFTFGGWIANGNINYSSSTDISITVDPGVQSIIATATVEYALDIALPECPDPKVRCEFSSGKITISGAEFFGGGRIWQTIGGTLPLQAEAFPGFVFDGWGGTVGLDLDRSTFAQIVMDRPRLLSPRFMAAKQVYLTTEPEELTVLVDRQPVLTPRTVDWAKGVPKLLGGETQRHFRGGLYVFDRWEGVPGAGGGAPGDPVVYTPPTTDNTVSTFKAIFIPGISVSFNTEPAGLRLKVGGRDNWTNYNFEWGVGRSITVEAPLEQTDREGRKYIFDGWSNGGAATQTLVVPSNGFNLVARYRKLRRLTFDTNPSGLPLTVNGSTCRTPCSVDGEAQTAARVSAATTISQGEYSRFELTGWSTGGEEPEQMVEFIEDRRNVVANYTSAHRIHLTANPAKAARFTYEPASEDGFWRNGTAVLVTAGSSPGFRFRRWEGELSGTYNTVTVNIAGPKFAVANYDEVPFADPAGVRNAAGVTPEPGVSGGSQAAIIGSNLAADTARGPESPLAQAVGGVVVRLGQRLLPIFWVSPERIDFQVPSDLEPGDYKVTVSRAGQPDVTSDLKLVRNAPGIFTRDEPKPGEKGLAFAFGPRGVSISATSPAAAGDEILLLATGAGPYDLRIPDGFLLPTSPDYRLVDPVEVIIGDRTVTPTFAGGNGGQIGVNAIRFRVPAGLSGSVELKIKSGGRESNTVVIPVR